MLGDTGGIWLTASLSSHPTPEVMPLSPCHSLSQAKGPLLWSPPEGLVKMNECEPQPALTNDCHSLSPQGNTSSLGPEPCLPSAPSVPETICSTGCLLNEWTHKPVNEWRHTRTVTMLWGSHLGCPFWCWVTSCRGWGNRLAYISDRKCNIRNESPQSKDFPKITLPALYCKWWMFQEKIRFLHVNKTCWLSLWLCYRLPQNVTETEFRWLHRAW